MRRTQKKREESETDRQKRLRLWADGEAASRGGFKIIGFRERLKEALELAFGSLFKARDRLGYDPTSKQLYNWTTPGRALPQVDEFWWICQAGNISPLFLLTGVGHPLDSKSLLSSDEWTLNTSSDLAENLLSALLTSFLTAQASTYLETRRASDLALISPGRKAPVLQPSDAKSQLDLASAVFTLVSAKRNVIRQTVEELHLEIDRIIEAKLAALYRYQSTFESESHKNKSAKPARKDKT